MTESDGLAVPFEKNRAHLRAVAYRMLGSMDEADDALQEAWLKVSRSAAGEVHNLGGWLTTVVARVCLDMLRARGARREAQVSPREAQEEPLAPPGGAPGPDAGLLLAESIGPALLVILESLGPAERVAFVLHDMFDVPFEEVASILGRSPVAVRQLASRARRRVQGGAEARAADTARQHAVVSAFLAASREGNFEALLAVLDPEVILRADGDAVRTAEANRWGGAPSLQAETRGAPAVAETFRGRARGARLARINGDTGAVWSVGGQTRSAFVFTVDVESGRIVEIELVMEPVRLGRFEVVLQG